MLRQTLIALEDKTAWEHALSTIAHGPAHTWIYNQAITLSSQLETYLYYASADQFKALCPLAVRNKLDHKDILTPYGFGGMITQGNYPNFNQEWKTFIASYGYICGYLGTHPQFCDLKHFPSAELFSNTQIYFLDLSMPLETLFQQLAKTHRYELKQWQKDEIKIISDPAQLKKQFPSLYEQTLERVNAASVYHFSAETLEAIFTSENVLALGAQVHGSMEAISVFIYNSDSADYFLFASTEQGRKHTRGLLWTGIELLKNLNISYLNLGGGAKPNDSLEDFKRRFGGTAHNYYVLKQIYNENIFTQLCEATKVDKRNMQYFPPYYAKNR